MRRALSSAAALKESIITIDSIGSPNLYGGNIYGCNIYAGTGGNFFANMTSDGFSVYMDDARLPKIRLTTPPRFNWGRAMDVDLIVLA